MVEELRNFRGDNLVLALQGDICPDIRAVFNCIRHVRIYPTGNVICESWCRMSQKDSLVGLNLNI